ncbi:MAG TPA: putative Ig domain-containing protein, partial [Rhodocyclaceae bacterium]|nr:putative Ig domain-containing protein [Rhodocyclaceae bacterium]
VTNVNLPSHLTSGTYYVTVWSDSYDVILEDTLASNLNPDDPHELDNNNYKARAIDIIGGFEPPPPDLKITALTASPQASTSSDLTVNWTVTNAGAGEASGKWYDVFWLSDKPDLNASGAKQWYLGSILHDGGTAPGASYSASATFALNPAAAGKYLIAYTDFDPYVGKPYDVVEGNEDNNTRVTDTSVTAVPADLKVVTIAAPSENFSGEKTTVTWTVKNYGGDVWSGTRYWLDSVYLSPDPVFLPERATALGTFVHSNKDGLAAGASYTQSADVVLPRGIGGNYFLYVITDANPYDPRFPNGETDQGDNAYFRDVYYPGSAYEGVGGEQNNRGIGNIPVTYREPDLKVTGLVVPPDAQSGKTITVTYTVTNIGNRDTRENAWWDRLFLSKDGSLDTYDLQLAEARHYGILKTGDSYTGTATFKLPDGISGNFSLLAFTDSEADARLSWWNSNIVPEYRGVGIDANSDSVPEFRGEGNNITVAPLPVVAAPLADLQVTTVTTQAHITVGNDFTVTYTVANLGGADTPPEQAEWEDYIYLSRDPLLDLDSDRYMTTVRHVGGLAKGASYTVNQTLRAPLDVTGAWYVFVVTDPARGSGRGKVFEGGLERNNATPSTPAIFEMPPPSDLQVDDIVFGGNGQSGENIHMEWTVSNHSTNPTSTSWTDAVYLSDDNTWDIGDRLLGKVTHTGVLGQDGSYTASLDALIPPTKPGQYRVIVRPDIYNEVYEGPYRSAGEANNFTTSPNVLNVTVNELHLGVYEDTTLSTGQSRLYKLTVGQGQTLKVSLTTGDQDAANEIFIRYGDVPDGFHYDATYDNPLQANQTAVVPFTKPGDYYVLIRGHAETQANTPVRVLAEVVPFAITSVHVDQGGDSRWVTFDVRGAQFADNAILKVVRPDVAEYEPVKWDVIDSTWIRATFDFTNAPLGLYDLEVINPSGDKAIIAYRFLIERAMETDVTIGLGGPRVLAAGETGTYGVALQSLTNVDTPYVRFTFGVPEMGNNQYVYNLPFLKYYNDLRGQPDTGGADVPWASLDSATNTTGQILSSGYAYDVIAGGYAGATFNVTTYPLLKALSTLNWDALRVGLYEMYPDLEKIQALAGGPESMQTALPAYWDLWQQANSEDGLPDDCVIPFIPYRFNIVGAATPMTRDEFIADQTTEALKLRAAILGDTDLDAKIAATGTDDTTLAEKRAAIALRNLASDADGWVNAYLGALEQVGILRPVDEAPPIRQNTKVMSLMSTLATGILLGPVGDQIRTTGDLVEFFAKIKTWYGDTPKTLAAIDHYEHRESDCLDGEIPVPALPKYADYNLNLSHPTYFETFNIFVPYVGFNKDGASAATIALPDYASVDASNQLTALDFSRLYAQAISDSQLASISGPQGYGVDQFLPVGQALPYTVKFENPAAASSSVTEIRVASALDPSLDPTTFRLGDIKLGDVTIHIPSGRALFQGDFDLRNSKGYILRVSAGIDPTTSTASWVFQAIDPDTGEVLQDATRGLLLPNAADGRGTGQLGYTVQPKADLPSGTQISAQAVVRFNAIAPQETQKLTQTLDTQAPVTTLTATPVTAGGNDYEVRWSSADEDRGSGVAHVTVYVAEDGGDFKIWLRQTTDTFGVYSGKAGHTYEFLALATDNAGNREQPPGSVQAPDDGSGANLGGLPSFGETTQDLPPPPAPATPPTNPLFIEAQSQTPAATPLSKLPEFTEVERPFTAQAFATDFVSSGAGVGALAMLELPDGSVLASGGPNRGWLYRIPHDGGKALTPFVELDDPIYDLALDDNGQLWATTGGNDLLKLDLATGAVLARYGTGITQALAIKAGTGEIYVSSGDGIEIFDPVKATFRHFSDVRVDDLAFAPDGTLWGTTWPDRGDVVTFDKRGRATVQVRLDGEVDSIAFGQVGTRLEGLLFISANSTKGEQGAALTMVDLVSKRSVEIARGGSRGETVVATKDGRVLVAETHQIDVISPIVAPRVVATNPPDQAVVTLPLTTLTVTFDQDMYAGSATDSASVLDPAVYQVVRQNGSLVDIASVAYDATTRRVTLTVAGLDPDLYDLRVLGTVRSSAGMALGGTYISSFVAVQDFSSVVSLQFDRVRSDRGTGVVSYDITVTNTADYDLLVPAALVIDPARFFQGRPMGAVSPQGANGLWYIDLSGKLPGGVLKAGASIATFTVGITNSASQQISLGHGIYAVPYPNQKPAFTSTPVTAATAGQAYRYQAVAQDPDGRVITYLLVDGPAGLTVDSTTGILSWLPNVASPATSTVTLRAYDTRGGFDTQVFNIEVAGANHPPNVSDLPAEIDGKEGQSLLVGLAAEDVDEDFLHYYADNLPPGAVFDSQLNALVWTPDFTSAGTYTNVKLIVSDGKSTVTRSFNIVIAPDDAPPVLSPVPERTLREGDPVRLQLHATDADSGDTLSFYADVLPAGAFLDPNTGVFQWTPSFIQAGDYSLKFGVSDGTKRTETTVKFHVLNVNAAPVFDELGSWISFEGQTLAFRAFAFDPDNPGYVAQDRLPSGTLTELEGAAASVSYTVSGLPDGASFDPVTSMFKWVPRYDQAGSYLVHFTATDDGNGTGTPLTSDIVVPITIRNANRAPEMAEIPTQTVQRDAVFELPVTATDPDGNPLTLTVKGLPAFATFTDNGDGTGRFVIAPHSGDRGDYEIDLTATDNGDGQGALYAQSLTRRFILTVVSASEAPVIAPIGDKLALVGQKLSFYINAKDLDQDALGFTADAAPAGLTITPQPQYGRALVEWTPDSTVLGQTFTVHFKVTDNGNSGATAPNTTEQVVRIKVRDSNAAPVLSPIGNLSLKEGQPFSLQLSAVDPDGDPLTYSVTNLPAGASFDAVKGLFTWTPNIFSAGDYPNVRFAVSDGMAESAETVTISVQNTNQAPILVSLFPQTGREGAQVQFQLTVGDVDGDPVVFKALTALPDGSRFDSRTGLFKWTPTYDQAGDYSFTFEARDPAGATSQTTVSLAIANVNRAPVLTVSNHVALLGRPLSFQLGGSDADSGTTLTFSATGLPEGATLDPTTGVINWTPGAGQAGDYLVMASVSDGMTSTALPLVIRAALTAPAPSVIIENTPSFPAVPGQDVLVHVIAESFGNIAGLRLFADGVELPLDEFGRAHVQATQVGKIALRAEATDVDGLVGSTTSVIRVRDPQDKSAPTPSFASQLAFARLTDLTAITGSTGEANVDAWTLEIARYGDEHYTTLASGDGAVNNAAFMQLDPATLANGMYTLRLRVTDLGGRRGEASVDVEVDSATKTGRLQRNEADFSWSVGGHTLDFLRSYDSLNTSVAGSFGNGWRLSFRDVDLQTDVALTGREDAGELGTFQDGQRVVLTLPSGERAAFTFVPQKHSIPGQTWYTPAFQAESASGWQLVVPDTKLQRAGSSYYDLVSGVGYNPANSGDTDYILVAPDGTRYSIADGRIDDVRFTDGVHVAVSDSGLVASTGETVQFTLNHAGAIERAALSDGRQYLYDYDAQGRLVSVRNLEAATSLRYGYEAGALGRLTLVTGSGAGALYTYGPSGVGQAPISGDLGSSVNYLATPVNGSLIAGEVDHYAFTLRPSELASTASGSVYLGIVVEGHNGLAPVLPVMPGLTAIASSVVGNRAFALFKLDAAGLAQIDVAGSGVGDYTLSLFVAGDANRDGKVDGADAIAIAAAKGAVRGGAGYSEALDADGNGVIESGDLQLLMQNAGFTPNRAPVVVAGTVKTHVDLDVNAPVSTFVKDPEGDRTFFTLLGSTHGTAHLSGDGQSVVFTPEAGYIGTADFTIRADDGFGQTIQTIAVTISNAALTRLDFVDRNLRLAVGEGRQISLIGDFEDQANVELPASYVTLMSTDGAIGSLVAGGRINAVGKGSGVLIAERAGLRAATAFTVGVPTDTVQAYLYAGGMTVYPGAVSLAENVGKRQILANLYGAMDLAPASSGTHYYVSNDQIISVSADGLISARQSGEATVTVINGGAETIIPVKVEKPFVGPTVLGDLGGIVQGADGSIVAVAPGALRGNTTVSIEAVKAADLPAGMPDGMALAGAFKLDLGDRKLDTPIQLAIPTTGIAAGTKVVFMRYAEIPMPDGSKQPIWLQEETGVVGADGYARAMSPPYPGVTVSGTYTCGIAPDASFSQVRGQTYATFPVGINDGGSSFAMLSSLGGGAAMGAAFGLTAGFMLTCLIGYHELQIISVPAQGLPTVTKVGVQVDPGKVSDNRIEVNNPYSPSTSPATEPFVSSARFLFKDDGSGNVVPFVEIKGDRFTYDNPAAPAFAKKGSQIADLKVVFETPDGHTFEVSPSATSTDGDVFVEVPQTVSIGTAKIFVRRPIYYANGGTWDDLEQLDSNKVQLSYDARYIFGGMSGNQVFAIDSQTQDLVARINVSGNFPAPRAMAISSDNTRAYVTLRYNGAVALVDTIALQQVDVDGDTANGISSIPLLPGAQPFWIAIAKGGKKAYVSDEVAGRVYVIDIDPSSSTYNTLVKTIDVNPAPSGLRGMAINANGKRLFVAAPDKALFGRPGGGDGKVFVIDVEEGSSTYGQVVATLDAGSEPYGVSATNDPNVMMYTNRLSDSKGVVIVKGDVGNYTQTTVTLTLGAITDWFDVNNASSVVLSKDTKYAFVVGYNTYIQDVPSHDPNYDPNHPAGGNIGIIRDPLGPNPTLVGATREIPMSWPDNAVLSPDGNTLYAAFRGQRVVMAFDVAKMIAVVESGSPDLGTTAVDDIDPSIDVRANFKMLKKGGLFTDPVFGVPPGATNGPIGVGFNQGLVTQGGASLELLAPDASTSNLNPNFSWMVKGFEGAKARLYVSTFRGSDGLFPTDLGSTDQNPNRIFSSDLLDASSADSTGAIFIKQLPANLKLTAGQQYYWGVEVVSPSGTVVARDWRVFKTEAFKDPSKPYSSVTVLTHGFQLSPTQPANLADALSSFYQMAETIAKDGGEGVAARYQKSTGHWIIFYDGANSGALVGHDLVDALRMPSLNGRPIALVSDWYDESDFPTDGFSEAAADTFYSSLAQLNEESGGKIFQSPIHLIGHSRGTVVNSELAQRFGVYAPTVSLDMTALDVHDFNQPSLDIPIAQYIQAAGAAAGAVSGLVGNLISLWGMLPTNAVIPTGNFLDPDVQRWSNIAFADAYYQVVASNTPMGFGQIVTTPNGRYVPNFDYSVNLTGRAGFTRDDGLISASLLASGEFRAGGPHSRVWRWYGGTMDLSATTFQAGGEPVYRRLYDKTKTEFQGVTVPWYNAQSFALGSGPWEGIGTGWAFAPQGGVTYSGPMSATKVSLATDNTEAPNPSGMAVPSIFNGDFEEGALNRSWLLQYSAGGLATRLTGDLPGWSFHGGSFAKTRTLIDGDRLVTLADGTHAAMLDNDNYRIEHNRMVVPDWAEFLTVDAKVLTGKAGEKLLVRGYLADSSVPIELGSIALDNTGTNFQSYTFQVPTAFRGAGRLLEFSMSSGATADAEVLLDHVQFTKGLITDSTLDPSDKAVFFTDTTTGPTTGLSSQWVDLTNPFSQAFTVTVTTDPNSFLVVAGTSGDVVLNDNNAHDPLYTDYVLAPGAHLKLNLKSKFNADFIKTYKDADIPIQKTNLYFTITLANGSIRDEAVDLFYMPDYADGNATDGLWTFMDTMDGKTRTLSFDNAAHVELKETSDTYNLFGVSQSGGIVQGLTYTGRYVNALPDFATYQVEEGGRKLGTIKVAGYSVPKQTVGVSLATLRTMVQNIRTEAENYKNNPLTAVVHDPTGFSAGKYNIFLNLFPDAVITDAQWQDVVDGFNEWFGTGASAIYQNNIAQTEFSYGETGLNPIVMINQPWVNTVAKPDPNDDASRSFAGLDFAYNTFESTLTKAGAGAGSFGGMVIRDDISIASKRYLLSRVVNPERAGAMGGQSAMTLVVDGILRAYLSVGFTRKDMGRSYGWVVGHELAHNMGLFDEYIYSPFTNAPRDGGANFMSNANNIRVSSSQAAALHLAMDNPDTTVALSSTDALLSWYLDLDALDKSNRAGRQVLNLSPLAGDGEGSTDPLGGLLYFVSQNSDATSPVTSSPILISGASHDGIVNGQFSVADPAATDYGWITEGDAKVSAGAGVLTEDPRLASRFAQTFVVPAD